MNFESTPLPLAGVGVVVTRAEEPGGPLARRLMEQGARVHRWRALEVVPPEDPSPLARAAAALASYDWIVFPSANGVRALAGALALHGGSAVRLPLVATVGRSTADAARAAGFRVDLAPDRYGASGLVEAFRRKGETSARRVLIPASSLAGPLLTDGLVWLGAVVDQIVAYQVRHLADDADVWRTDLAQARVDAITFTSPSSVASVATTLGSQDFAALGDRLLISIGPTTTRGLAEHGLRPNAEAEPSTLDGVVAATIAAVAASADRRIE
jgi:uroporphyrinogen-III synthase